MTTNLSRNTCVIGWQIEHSRSPLIHGFWLKQHGIDGSYEKRAVQPAALGQFMHSLRQGAYVGCNVTIPHKQTILSLVDEPDDRVRRTGSVNTIYKSGSKICATSTDGQGFYANLIDHQPHYDVSKKPIVILGAGGSARAILDELLLQGATKIQIFNRTYERALELRRAFGSKIEAMAPTELRHSLESAGLLINTTPTGLAAKASIDIPWPVIDPATIIADIVYTPLKTRFLQEASEHGLPIVTGLGMLLHQAVVGFEKWYGVRPVVTSELHDLVARDIDQDFQP